MPPKGPLLSLILVITMNAGCSPFAAPELNIVDFNPDVNRRAWKPVDVFSDPAAIDLATAVQSSDLSKLDQLIAQGADIRAEGKGNLDQLSWALLIRNKVAFRKLLEKGADPNHRVLKTVPLVYLAATNGKDSEWLELLLKFKCDPDAEFGLEKHIPLKGVIYYTQPPGQQKNIELLIRAGADLNHRDHLGNTPAMIAIMHNRYDLAYEFLQAGADLHIKDEQGRDLMYDVMESDFEPGTLGWPWREKVIDFLQEKGADFTTAEKLLAVTQPQKLDIWKKHLTERARTTDHAQQSDLR